MCGIAGIVSSDLGSESLREALLRMQKSLLHRGPDDQGLWVSPNGRDGLAHTRLAILDFTQDAAQPMTNGSHHLVFNGEIYNYRELQKIPGGGDSRVLLEWLVDQGIPGLSALAGMYAFGFYDQNSGSLLLARDPLGIKPLYYADTPKGFVFSSEVRAILASGLVTSNPDPCAAAEFFRTGSVPEPLTFFRGIKCLLAGHHLKRQVDGAIQIEQTDLTRTPTESLGLASALRESCQRHLVSDVPVGVFLSAGVDSTAVARLATLEGQVTEAFSLIFEEKDFSEERGIRSVASAMKLRLHLKSLARKDAGELFPRFLAAQDQPSLDGFNTYCVADFASEEGFKVVLSGLGGDELFGGYPSFHSVPLWRRRASCIPGILRYPVGFCFEGLGRNGRLRRVGAWLKSPPTYASAYQLVRGIFSPKESKLLMSHFGLMECLEDKPVVLEEKHSDPRSVVGELEASRYLRNQLLRDSDVMSMAHGLELRTPLVDARLWSFVKTLPPAVRFQPHKGALRNAVPGLDAIPPQGPKRGFTLPLQRWMDASWPGVSELKRLQRSLDLSHWSRKMAVISMTHHLGASKI